MSSHFLLSRTEKLATCTWWIGTLLQCWPAMCVRVCVCIYSPCVCVSVSVRLFLIHKYFSSCHEQQRFCYARDEPRLHSLILLWTWWITSSLTAGNRCAVPECICAHVCMSVCVCVCMYAYVFSANSVFYRNLRSQVGVAHMMNDDTSEESINGVYICLLCAHACVRTCVFVFSNCLFNTAEFRTCWSILIQCFCTSEFLISSRNLSFWIGAQYPTLSVFLINF